MNVRALLSYPLLILMTIAGCAGSETVETSTPADFREYISSYTSGEISVNGEVAVTFAQPIPEEDRASSGLIELNPSASGTVRWVNDRTMVFSPANSLRRNQEYTVSVKLSEVMAVEGSENEFVFSFTTMQQDMEVELDDLKTDPNVEDRMLLKGVIYTSDEARPEDVKRTISATQSGESLRINWLNNENLHRFTFEVSNIQRQEEESQVQISWNGAPIDAGSKGKTEITVSERTAFELLATRVTRDTDPGVILTFSDPLDASQDLEGLIRFEQRVALNFIVDNNQLIINPRTRRAGTQVLLIDEALLSADGKRLDMNYRREVRFNQPKPQVAWLGKGVIIPKSEDLYVPFKAVSLGAVDVQVTRIFENNIGQFLQDQTLSGVNTWNVRRVGRPVYQGTMPLSALGSVDPGIWNNYALDLSELMEPEPGAIYQVQLGFRQHQAVYDCGESNSVVSNVLAGREWVEDPETEQAYWARFGDRYYPENYRWENRNDPCTTSYYNGNRRVTRNVFASDLGMIAKKAENGKTMVFITDLRTVKPVPGVSVTLFDYQQQEIVTAETDASGIAEMQSDRPGYYATASYDGQKGYLRLNDGNSLSLSEFDVSGASVQKGIKGFMYGERGVWRPGDTLFVTFILEDKLDVLPDEHPVIFELRNPSGQLTDRKTFTGSLNGYYVYEGKTEKQSPTGNWTLEAKVGGLNFTESLKIETVKPNRLKVEVVFEEDKIIPEDRTLTAVLSSQWLHGAQARDLKADVEMSLVPSVPPFDNYAKFSFSDQAVSFTSTPELIFDGTLGSNGNAEFQHTMPALKEGPARLRVNLNTRVFEPSGNFSVGRSGTFYYPFKTIVGLKTPEAENNRYGNWLSRTGTHVFEMVSLNTEGVPVANTQLEYEVYNIRWRWWWERGRENLSNYFESNDVRRVISGEVMTDADGFASVDLKLPEGESGGRYLVRIKDPEGGHSASETVYFSWYGGRNSGVSPAQLTFSSDKESYSIGEVAELTIPRSADGRLLISLETGSEILKTEWIDGEAGETVYRFNTTPDMSPNVYAHVMHIQPHAQKENDLPIRMYGVIPVMVSDPQTELNPVLSMQEELRPETVTELSIGEENGRPMTYTIAMVDEGLLDLTNFRTPDPHTHFYAREALGIKTWDLFEYVTSGFSGNISRILSVGGDGSETESDPLNEANRFEPMVRFDGPFYLKEGSTNRHSISIPNYVGSVRTMVVAGMNGAYGRVDKTTPVRKPVMVLATLPRVVGPGESVRLPVSVFAMQDGIGQVEVTLEASEIFSISGPRTKTVEFDETGDQFVNFDLEVDSKTGVGSIRVEAKSGNETAYHEIEIAVRNPNTPVTQIRNRVLEDGAEWSEAFNAPGMEGTNTATLELSRVPPIDFSRRLNYLLRYPHGCIEQTTSSVFPQLYLGNVMELTDERKARVQQNVDAGIQRIGTFMAALGGLAYWPGGEDANSWGTTYAYHFLLEAKKTGYYVPSELMRKVNQYQRSMARNWSAGNYRRSDLMQAYRLYTLALAGTPEMGAMNRFRERRTISNQARWRLASAYLLAGQPEAAADILTTATTAVDEYRELSGSYGSSVRDRAMILETLTMLQRKEEAALLARDLSDELSSQSWLSTQTTAYALIAISKYLEESDAAGEIEAEISVNGSQQQSVRSFAIISRIPLTINSREQNELQLKNRSGGSLFARLILTGTPLIGDTVSISNSLEQKVRFADLMGNEIDVSELEQGIDFIAEVTVTNPGLKGNYEEIALSQIFPSGWEIRNARMDGNSFREPASDFEYQDIRDDRVYTYFDLKGNQKKIFRIQLNASYLGTFYMPGVSTEAMYDATISARSSGKWVKVVEPQ